MEEPEQTETENINSSTHVDGQFRISVSRDGVVAYFSRLSPATGNGKNIALDQVLKKLKSQKVIYGIDQNKISQILQQLENGKLDINIASAENDQKKRQEVLCIAKGDPAVKGSDAVIEWHIPKARIEAGDYHPFPNELIATLTPPGNGQPGKNVFGQVIKPKPAHNNMLKTGANVKRVQVAERAELRAVTLGTLKMEAGVVQILSPVQIAEDRMTATINIEPPSNAKQSLEMAHVKQCLEMNGVRFGVCEESLQQALQVVNDSHQPQLAVVAAQGTKVVMGQDACIKWHLDLQAMSDKVQVVKPGELIATVALAVPSQQGMDVTNQPIPAGDIKQAELPQLDGLALALSGKQQILKAERYGYLEYDAAASPPALSIKPAITISDDKMEVFADIYAKSATGQAITNNDLASALTGAGIKHGVDAALLEALLDDAQQHGNNGIANQVVAHGTPPTHGKDARLVVYHEKHSTGLELTNGRIDFHEHSYPWNVEKGATVGYLLAFKPAIAGMTVLGKMIKAKPPKKLQPELKGLHCDDKGRLIADFDGALLIAGKHLTVVDLLVMNKDIGVRTGNVHCNTSVHVKGHIDPGYEVESKKDIIIERNVENAKVHSGGELVIKGGIRGQSSEVFAAGDVTTKFIENASLYVNGNVFVNRSIINSKVASNSNINVGDNPSKHCAVIGGELIAHAEITAVELGSSSFPRTIIKVGLTQESRRELNQLDDQISAKKDEVLHLNQIEYHYKTHPDKSNEELLHKVTVTRSVLMQEIANLGLLRSEINEKIEAALHPSVTVEKWVYPGVIIELGSHSFEVHSKLGPGKFTVHEDGIVFRPK
ncbi:flagellar assembly protein A [Pseudomonadota bacterium]